MSSNGNDLGLGFSITGGDEAVSVIGAVGDKADESAKNVDGLGTSGQSVGPKLTEGVKPIAPALDAVAVASAKVQVGLDKMATAQGPRGIIMGAVQAKNAMEELATAMRNAGVAEDQIAAKTKAVSDACSQAATQAAKVKEEMLNMRVAGNVAATGMEGLSMQLGSTHGLMRLLKSTLGETGAAIAGLGFAGLAAEGALKLLDKAGQGVVDSAKAIGNAYVDMVDRQSRAVAESVLLANAQRAIAQGLKDSNGDLILTVEQYRTFIATSQHGTQVTKDFAAAQGFKLPPTLKELDDKMMEYGITASNVYKDTEKAALDSGKGQDEANKLAERSVLALQIRQKSFLEEEKKGYQEVGAAVPADIQKAIDAIQKWEKAEKLNQAALEDGKHGLDSYVESLSKKWEADQKAVEATNKLVESAIKQHTSDEELQQGLEKIAAASGKTVGGLLDLVKAATAQRTAIQAARAGMDDYTGGMDKFKSAIETATEQHARFMTEAEKLVKIPPTMAQLTVSAGVMSKALEAAAKEGGGAFAAMAKENDASINKLVTDLKARGMEIPPIFQQASQAAKAFSEETKAALLTIPQSASQVSVAAQDMASQLGAAGASGSKAFTAMAVANESAIQKMIADLKLLGITVPAELEKAIEAINKYKNATESAAKETLYTMTIIQTEMMKATDAATQSVLAQCEAIKKLHDQLGTAADATVNYAALMKASWESGTASLTGWNEQMSITIQQMDILVMKNFGTKFAEDTKKMADALRALQASVNAGNVPQTPKIHI